MEKKLESLSQHQLYLNFNKKLRREIKTNVAAKAAQKIHKIDMPLQAHLNLQNQIN